MTFEEWYAGYNPAHKSDKERAEDAWKAAAQPAVQQGEPLAWMDDGNLRAGSEATAYRVVTDATRRGMTASLAASFITPLYAHPAAPVAQGDARVQGLIAAADYIDGPASGYAAEHSYTEPSPMAKVAAALRQKAEQEDAAYQARRSDQGLMESEWGPMEDAPPHEDPPMHVAVVEGDDAVRTLQWNRDVAAFAYPVGTLLYAAHPAAPVAQGDALPREDFAWMVVQEACETEPADEDDPECIRILRRDLKSAVLAAFLREDAARAQQEHKP